MRSATCSFPAPPAGTVGSFCERVFAYRADTPCVRGNHSSLCISLPQRRLSQEEYERRVSRLKEPQVRVQIIGNRIYIVKSTMPSVGTKYHRNLFRHVRHIAGAASLHALPDVDFVLLVGDGSPVWPIFAHNSPLARRGTPSQTFHVPTDTGVKRNTKPPAGNGCAAPSEDERTRWAAMHDRLVFRGSATGTPVTTKRWRSNMRARLAALAILWPDLIDAKLTSMFKMSEERVNRTRHFLRMGKTMPMSKIGSYRFVSHCDGHSQANRLGPLLHSGSVVLLATEYDVELSASMHKFAHVFSLKPDLSDLLPTLACLRAHPDLVLRRLRHGLDAARTHATYKNSVLHYWADLLEHYKRVAPFAVRKHPLAEEAVELKFNFEGKHELSAHEKREARFPYSRNESGALTPDSPREWGY